MQKLLPVSDLPDHAIFDQRNESPSNIADIGSCAEGKQRAAREVCVKRIRQHGRRPSSPCDETGGRIISLSLSNEKLGAQSRFANYVNIRKSPNNSLCPENFSESDVTLLVNVHVGYNRMNRAVAKQQCML